VWHNNKSGLVRIVLIGELPGNHTYIHGQVQKDIAEGMEKKDRIQMDGQWAKYGY
jgi:hypothetical protein